MAFGGAGCPQGYVTRTFTTKVMTTPAKSERAFELLVAAGDVWAWCIDRFHERLRAGLPAANSVVQLWPDQKAHGPFGDLTAHCAQDVTKGWSASYFEVMRRRRAGQRAHLPLRKRYRLPVCWRRGEFELMESGKGGRARVELKTRRGAENLTLTLARDHPYDPHLVRAVRLYAEAGELFVAITANVAVIDARSERATHAGVDPGIIHPLVVAAAAGNLVISGRAIRSEEFLHLEDGKARQRALERHRKPVRAYPGKPRQAGSRRWQKIARSQRASEARSRRRVRLSANRAANLAAEHIVDVARAGTVFIGDPRGIEKVGAGRVQNRRVGRWARTHTARALGYRLGE